MEQSAVGAKEHRNRRGRGKRPTSENKRGKEEGVLSLFDGEGRMVPRIMGVTEFAKVNGACTLK